jgi:hypothetical protein
MTTRHKQGGFIPSLRLFWLHPRRYFLLMGLFCLFSFVVGYQLLLGTVIPTIAGDGWVSRISQVWRISDYIRSPQDIEVYRCQYLGKCHQHSALLNRQFQFWSEKSMSMQEHLEKAYQRCKDKKARCARYYLRNNVIHIHEDDFDMATTYNRGRALADTLLLLAARINLPDAAFVFVFGDHNIVEIEPDTNPKLDHLPLLFSSFSTDGFADVPVPNPCMLWLSGEWRTLSSWSIPSFSSKRDVAFWRGSPTGGDYDGSGWRVTPRSQLVRQSLRHSDMIDCHFTKCSSCPSAAALGGMIAPAVSMRQMLRYRYLVIVDGNNAPSSRYATLLGATSPSVMIKQNSSFGEWFYPLMKPFVHYLPVHHDFGDLTQLISYARDHPELAEEIARNGRDFVWKYLSFDGVLCHWHSILMRMRSILTDDLTANERSHYVPLTLWKMYAKDKCW